MLRDGNPMVVANAIYSLQTIELSGGPKVRLDQNHIQKFLTALNEATEWGQSIILDCISNFKPTSSDMAERVIVRIKGFTRHRNPGVNLSAIRVIIKYLDFVEDSETVRSFCKGIRPCLITLLSAEPEIQYVSLKNITILAEKQPFIVETELKHFFCNFSDPLYVKNQKLEIMVRLANESNIDMILHELKEYVTEVDIDFVRKCISAIGKLSIKIEKTATKCVFALRDIINNNHSNLIIQETIIVLKGRESNCRHLQEVPRTIREDTGRSHERNQVHRRTRLQGGVAVDCGRVHR
jgi:vesicle coat complex subunit